MPRFRGLYDTDEVAGDGFEAPFEDYVMTDLTFDEFDAVFDRFVTSPTSTIVFRWEQLQHYAVSTEDPSLEAFRTGAPRPERSVRTRPWLARIARSVLDGGKTWQRVRYAEEPWSLYTAHEMLGYQESQAAGDQTFVTTVQLARARTDFWLFSGSTTADQYAVDMHYSSGGRPERFEYLDDPDLLRDRQAAASEALSNAVPLNSYLARHTAPAAGPRIREP